MNDRDLPMVNLNPPSSNCSGCKHLKPKTRLVFKCALGKPVTTSTKDIDRGVLSTSTVKPTFPPCDKFE